MLGLDLDAWNNVMVLSLGFAALAALAVVVSTATVIKLQKESEEATRREFDRYKLEASEKIAASAAVGEAARADAARANESSERLKNDTVRLQADNLALQTVLLPRHAGLIGIDRSPPAADWFAGIAPFAGTELLIEVANDKEAGNLANEIAIIVTKFGWTARLVDEKRTHFNPDQIRDGISVSYPIGKPWGPDNQNEPWFNWAKAAEALADALTRAGLAVGDRRVSRFGFVPNDRSAAIGLSPNFDPPLQGVFLQVGARPVAETVEWIKQGRTDGAGNKPANPVSVESHK
jgi:hypothetical protein